MMKNKSILRKALLELIENQLHSREVPEVNETYERLVSEGFSENEAKRLISAVILC
jgi:hypothetical protein